jgi:hypothetical protein
MGHGAVLARRGTHRSASIRAAPPAAQDVAAEVRVDYPVAVRHYFKEQLYTRLEGNGAVELDPAALRERILGVLKTMELAEGLSA